MDDDRILAYIKPFMGICTLRAVYINNKTFDALETEKIQICMYPIKIKKTLFEIYTIF